MNDFVKTALQRIVQAAVTSGAAYLVSVGLISHDQEQSFIGALFFLLSWGIDTAIVHWQKDNAAVSGGNAVAAVASDTFTTDQVKSIVKGAPK